MKQEIERIGPKEGKMFGVLVVEEGDRSQESGDRSAYGFLAAYSGLLEGRNDWDYFVPPVYDAQQPDGYFKTREREISEFINEESRTLPSSPFPLPSKTMSQELQLWLFR